jgi:4-nitrophenyl phosphatase
VAWAFDLDGVIWLGDRPIAGSADAVNHLIGLGEHVAFVTNNSYGRRSAVVEKLGRLGIDATDMVITSAMAAAALVRAGERALVCGGPGIIEELELRGVEVIDAGEANADSAVVDVVVVGYHPTFDYRRMTIASGAVRSGARLLATNDDATYPTATGPIPGGGAILASIVTAAGVQPEIAGKPHKPIADLTRELLGSTGTMVGDRPDTDGRFALTLGYRFGLVLSGVTARADLPTEPPADLVADDLAELVQQALSTKSPDR